MDLSRHFNTLNWSSTVAFWVQFHGIPVHQYIILNIAMCTALIILFITLETLLE